MYGIFPCRSTGSQGQGSRQLASLRHYPVPERVPNRLQTQDDTELIGSLFFFGPAAPQLPATCRSWIRRRPVHTAEWANRSQLSESRISFPIPPLGTFATTPRSICCGPGENEWDFTLSKKHCAHREARTSSSGPTFSTCSTGRSSSIRMGISRTRPSASIQRLATPRLVQFALKLLFLILLETRAAKAARPNLMAYRPEIFWRSRCIPHCKRSSKLFERRTPKSAEAHKKNLKRLPLGVASNYRAYDPISNFCAEGFGGRFRDLDGNEYIDHNLCFGALMAGHCHPPLMKAVEERPAHGRMLWHAAQHGVGTGGRDLHPLSGRDVPLRQQRDRSHDAHRFVWRAPQPGATRSSSSRADITGCTMRRWSA